MDKDQLLEYLYYRKLPSIYRIKDEEIGFPLKRYLQALVDGGFYHLINDTQGLMNLIDPEKCPSEFLPLLCSSFGLEYFNDLDDIYQRRFLMNIGDIIKRRGTYSCARFLAKSVTGLESNVKYIRGEYLGVQGRHLIITLFAKTIEEVLNIDTSVKVVERYIETQIPYYIDSHVRYEIANQDIIKPMYRGNVMCYYGIYKIGGA